MTVDAAVAAHPFDEHPPEHGRGPLERAIAQARGELDRS
jgi:hypothetical protein